MYHIIIATTDTTTASQASPSTVRDDPVWGTLLDETGQPVHAYTWLVAELFDPSTAEGALAHFLARHPDYTFQEDVLEFLGAQPDIGSEIVSHGWNHIVSDINAAMLDALEDPDIRHRLQYALKLSAPYTAIEKLREHIAARSGTGWTVTAAYAEKGLPPSELAALQKLQDDYDHSKSERDAEKIYSLIGHRIREMFTRQALGRRLSPDQVHALSWQALHQALNLSGVSRFIRSNAPHNDWAAIIQACRPGQTQTAVGARIWNLLSPQFKEMLANKPPLQASTRALDEAFVKELNSLLRRPDFYDPSAWAGVELPQEAQELLAKGVERTTDLTRLNLLATVSAFPTLTTPQRPQNLLLGYVYRVATQTPMKGALYEAATGRSYSTTEADTYSFLKNDIESVKRMRAEHTLPEAWENLPLAEQIYRHQKQRLQQLYGGIIAWWNGTLAALQPSNPFVLTNSRSLQSAKEIFLQHPDRVPQQLWAKPGSPYYLPTRVLHHYGLESIERLLDSQSPVPAKNQPAPLATQAPAPEADAALHWLRGGHASRAYQYLADKMFAPGSAESEIAHFLEATPTPSRVQITEFLDSLPQELSDDIAASGGFDRVSMQMVDRKILEEVRNNPDIQRELQSVLGSQAVTALFSLRKTIFSRMMGFINKINKVA